MTCRGKIIFGGASDGMICNPRLLFQHNDACREAMNRIGTRGFVVQEKYDKHVKEVFADVKGSLQTGAHMWQELCDLARNLTRRHICNVYPPHRKQFIRCVREVRKQAASHRNKPISEIKHTIVFKN
jgi:hypothetical protein